MHVSHLYDFVAVTTQKGVSLFNDPHVAVDPFKHGATSASELSRVRRLHCRSPLASALVLSPATSTPSICCISSSSELLCGPLPAQSDDLLLDSVRGAELSERPLVAVLALSSARFEAIAAFRADGSMVCVDPSTRSVIGSVEGPKLPSDSPPLAAVTTRRGRIVAFFCRHTSQVDGPFVAAVLPIVSAASLCTSDSGAFGDTEGPGHSWVVSTLPTTPNVYAACGTGFALHLPSAGTNMPAGLHVWSYLASQPVRVRLSTQCTVLALAVCTSERANQVPADATAAGDLVCALCIAPRERVVISSSASTKKSRRSSLVAAAPAVGDLTVVLIASVLRAVELHRIEVSPHPLLDRLSSSSGLTTDLVWASADLLPDRAHKKRSRNSTTRLEARLQAHLLVPVVSAAEPSDNKETKQARSTLNVLAIAVPIPSEALSPIMSNAHEMVPFPTSLSLLMHRTTKPTVPLSYSLSTVAASNDQEPPVVEPATQLQQVLDVPFLASSGLTASVSALDKTLCEVLASLPDLSDERCSESSVANEVQAWVDGITAILKVTSPLTREFGLQVVSALCAAVAHFPTSVLRLAVFGETASAGEKPRKKSRRSSGVHQSSSGQVAVVQIILAALVNCMVRVAFVLSDGSRTGAADPLDTLSSSAVSFLLLAIHHTLLKYSDAAPLPAEQLIALCNNSEAPPVVAAPAFQAAPHCLISPGSVSVQSCRPSSAGYGSDMPIGLADTALLVGRSQPGTSCTLCGVQVNSTDALSTHRAAPVHKRALSTAAHGAAIAHLKASRGLCAESAPLSCPPVPVTPFQALSASVQEWIAAQTQLVLAMLKWTEALFSRPLIVSMIAVDQHVKDSTCALAAAISDLAQAASITGSQLRGAISSVVGSVAVVLRAVRVLSMRVVVSGHFFVLLFPCLPPCRRSLSL